MLLDWNEVVDSEMRPRPTTDRMHEAIRRQRRWLRGSVRLMMGRLVTDEDYSLRRKTAMRKSL